MSPNEEAVFSTYAQVEKNVIIGIEVVVVGTRPFYGLESKTKKFIQWKSSIVVLPVVLPKIA